MTLREQLLEAIERSGLTRYRIAKDADLDYASFVRFLDEPDRDLRLSTVEKLAELFDMRFTRPKLRRK